MPVTTGPRAPAVLAASFNDTSSMSSTEPCMPTRRHGRTRSVDAEASTACLRQYFPKGTDLATHNAEDLAWVEQEMNDRPRARLQFAKPQELMTQLLLH